ncbi:MAG: hypothetical protein GQ569_11335 [Methylococcaceae bacterium]|nr:hypothetical protein [Methylococcaceae bacterium]
MKFFKHLHHHSELNAVQFVTFRTQDSLDDFLKKLINSNIEISKKQWQIDQYVDKSPKGAYLNADKIKLLASYLKELESEFYDLIAFSIMPNHVHLLFTQKQELSVIMQKVKGKSAIFLNEALGKKGTFWQKDYYDKKITDERHFRMAYGYIENNALKAKLKDADERFYGLYDNMETRLQSRTKPKK